jgi:regulator of protease activity HflC (stomatin/prohibitin superfamily)
VIRLASARGVAHRMRSATDQNMQVRTRKLIGTILLLLFLAVYATAAAVIGSGRIALTPQWVQFAFYLTTGLLWVIPAGLLVRWMQRPD